MLEHVSLWAGNLGWIKVRPEDVLAHGFSCPVSPTQRLLRCEICKNYVQLTDVSFGRIVDPFFKHLGGTFPYGGERRTSDGWEPCPDNVGGPPGGGGETPPNPEEQEIPVYLSVSGGLFNWEVKLPQLSENNATWTVNSLFEITFGEPISERYRFRFSRSGGVRFAVGANPPEACDYMIRKQNASGWTDAFLAPKSWRIVGGRGRVHLFRKGGWAAFSDDTGKLLPVGADIGVGKWVRIATKMRLAYGTGVESIRLAQKGSWMVYRVRIELDRRSDAIPPRMAPVCIHPDASDSQKPEDVLLPSRRSECRPTLAWCRMVFSARTRFAERKRNRDHRKRPHRQDILHPCRRPLGHLAAKRISVEA